MCKKEGVVMSNICPIVLEHVEKKIKSVSILKDLNLQFEAGKIYGVYGTNGSGKTMLLRMMAGLIRPTSGRVLSFGKELHKEIDFPERIGVVIENPDFWKNYTGRQVLQTLAGIKKIVSPEEIEDSLERVGLEPGDGRTIRKYSLGMKQRLGIAQAIMEKPDILLLDEPTNALDENGIVQIETIIRQEAERGAVVVLASHNVQDLNLCHERIRMREGYAEKDGD